MLYNDGHKHIPLQTPGRQRRLSPATDPNRRNRGAFPFQRLWVAGSPGSPSAGERPALRGRGRFGPAPCPPWSPRESPRPATGRQRAPSVSSRALLASDKPRRGGCSEHHLPGQLSLSVHSGVPGPGGQGKLSCEPADPGSPPPEPRPPPGAGDRRAARPGGVAASSPEP